MKKIRYTLLFISFCITLGCSQWIPEEKPIVRSNIVPTEPIAQVEYYLQQKDSDKAIEVLQQQPVSAETLYYFGQAYNLKGDFLKAFESYFQAVEKQTNYYAAYQASKNACRVLLTAIRQELDSIQEQLYQAKNKGEGDLTTIQKQYEEMIGHRTRIYLFQAKLFLIYEDTEMLVSDFPELEAHLRDTQDLLKEMEEGRVRPYTKLENVSNPYYAQIIEMRAKISKKHVAFLLRMADEYAQKGDYYRTIYILKDADAQIAKFYREEDPTAEFSLLTTDPQVQEINQLVLNKILEYGKKTIAIHTHNKECLEQIHELQQAEDEGKAIEQILENMIQAQIQGFWRNQKIKKEVAEQDPIMITLYEQYISQSPNSGKSGDYYYRLAKFYLHVGNREKGLHYAKLAEEKLGSYRVKDLLEK